MFEKILIANRGEIACRIIRTCRRLGIATVAVYSEADADALHVAMADEAVLLGPPPAAESYLRSTGSSRRRARPAPRRSIPGYGFLSERAAFAERSQDAGIAFIGPPVAAIEAMGDKIESKRLAQGRRRPDRARHRRARSRDAADAIAGRARDRLPGDDQGRGRRRRQGHAHRPRRGRAARGLERASTEARVVVRRRPRVPREVRRGAAPHRDPGAGRPARQPRPPRRARMLDPAPAPEGDRGGALAVPRRGDPARRWASRRSPWRGPSATTAPARSSSSSTGTATSTSSR